MVSVLLTGSETHLGAAVHRALAAHTEIDLVLADPATWTKPAALLALLRHKQVQVVVHLAMWGEETPLTDREAAVQHNVIGTMLLLGACQRAGVTRVVVRSSSMVYGASTMNPAFVSEDAPLTTRPQRASLLTRQYAERDRFAQEFAQKHPQLTVVLLRCAALLGAGCASPLARYLAQPTPGMLPGFDPRMQLVHPDDAAAAFALAATRPVAGPFNVAADNPLPLSQLIRLSGRQPHALLAPLLKLPRWLHRAQYHALAAWPYGKEALRAGCVVDTRRAQQMLGWQPAHTARAVAQSLAKPAAPARGIPVARPEHEESTL